MSFTPVASINAKKSLSRTEVVTKTGFIFKMKLFSAQFKLDERDWGKKKIGKLQKENFRN